MNFIRQHQFQLFVLLCLMVSPYLMAASPDAMTVANNLPIIGIALCLAFFAGKISHLIKIPQVTGFILVGVFLGPTVLNLLTVEMADSYKSINEIAFGLILFNIGGEFHRGLLEQVTRKHVRFSVVYCFVIWAVTFVICFAFSFLSDLSLVHKFVFSFFLGAVAMEAAPPTTVLVMKELGAKGPLSRTILVYLATSTVLILIVTHIMSSVFEATGIWSGTDMSLLKQAGLIIWSVVGSLLFGLVMGMLLSFWEQREDVESELLFAVICCILLGNTIAYFLHLEPLLVSLFMGFALVNTSPAGQAIHYKLKGMGLSIYALFFVLAGAHIHLQEQIKTVGVLGFGYMFARIVAMRIGSKYAARWTDEAEIISKHFGNSTLSHAGTALAIAASLMKYGDESAKSIVTVVMSSIFFFEIIGPLLLRKTLLEAKEVTLGGLIGENLSRTFLSAKELLLNSLESLGIMQPPHPPHVKTIGPLLNRKVFAIDCQASLKEVLHFVEKHHLPIYPVVDSNNSYQGIISIHELKEVTFDPYRAEITRASKLIGSRACLTEDTTCAEALVSFNDYGLEDLPVVNPDNQKLLGMVSYKEVILALKD